MRHWSMALVCAVEPAASSVPFEQVTPPEPAAAPLVAPLTAVVLPLVLLFVLPPLEPQAARAIELATASAAIVTRRVRLTTFTILRAGVSVG